MWHFVTTMCDIILIPNSKSKIRKMDRNKNKNKK